ncbi:MAG: PocR ligand-binding domain-containing protein, partial [Verrucomicrobiota bacterium]
AAGYHVRTANGGEPAVEMVADRLPDLILLDVRMPGIDGFDVLRKLKGTEESRNIPVLMISAFAELDERIEGLKLGAVDSVTKPFHAGELLARVRMQLELSGLRAQHASHTAVLKSANEELQREVARRERAEGALQARLFALTQPEDRPEDIRFSDLINIEDLQQLQDEFSNATGVASLITEPDGTPLTKPSNFCRLCSEIIRNTEAGRRNCRQSDAALGAPCSSGPIIQPCLSGGLWDAGASITVGGKHIANWLIGQVRNEEQDEEQMLRYADEIGADREEFRQALAEVPVMSRERFEKTARALFTFAREISSRAYQNVQQARFITEHRQAEEDLRKSESRLNFALETLSAGAWDLDLVDHTAHRTLLHDRIFGYETLLPAWTYEIFLDHVLPEDRTDVDRCFREATEACCDWGFECRIRRTDGEVRWIWATGSHERNAEGKPVRMSGIVQDITDRRAVEAALRENETNLSLTLQSIGDAVIATNVGGRIIRMNPVAERLTGWPFAEAEGRSMGEVFRIVNARTRKPTEDPVSQVIESGVTVGLANHTVLLARDGQEYQIADSAAPIRDPYGELLGVVLVFRDVTGRYEAEARIARLSRLYAALSQCNQAIVHSSSLEELLPKICSDVVEFGGLKMTWIALVDEASGLVRSAAAHGEGREYVEGIQISTNLDEPAGRGPVGTSIRENQPAWCQDFQNDPNTAPWHERGALYGWASCASLPLRRRGKTIGALAVYSDKADAFDDEVRKLLVDMADDISFAIDSFSGDAERRRTEQALLQKGNEYERLLEHLSAGVVVHSHDSAIVLANTMASTLLGLTKDQMLGRTAMDPAWCFLREDGTLAPLAEYPVQRVLASGEPIRSQVLGISRPGIAAPTWVLCNAYPEHDEAGQISQVIVSFIDITERKTTEGRVARLTHLYAALSQCNQTIVHAASVGELLPTICRDVVKFGGMQMAWIGMVDDGRT